MCGPSPRHRRLSPLPTSNCTFRFSFLIQLGEESDAASWRSLRGQSGTHLPSLPASTRAARAFLREALQTWNLDGFGEVTEALTDELVANVVRHVDAPMTVRAYRQSDSIRVEVDDASNDPPVPQHRDPLGEHGRGLLLIDKLASKWGFTQHGGDGKTVWFEIDLTTATDEVHRRSP